MLRLTRSKFVAALALLVVAIGLSVGFAQSGKSLTESEKRQITAKLELLRKAAASMGERHPRLPQVRSDIAELEEQLRENAGRANPFSGAIDVPNADDPQAAARLVQQMSDAELRLLVIQLAQEVNRLNARVDTLETEVNRKRVF